MNLDNVWRIRSDAFQFILEERTMVAKRDKATRQPTGEVVEDWITYGFYPSVDQLARAIATKEARAAAGAVETIAEFRELFTAAVESVRVQIASAMDDAEVSS